MRNAERLAPTLSSMSRVGQRNQTRHLPRMPRSQTTPARLGYVGLGWARLAPRCVCPQSRDAGMQGMQDAGHAVKCGLCAVLIALVRRQEYLLQCIQIAAPHVDARRPLAAGWPVCSSGLGTSITTVQWGNGVSRGCRRQDAGNATSHETMKR